MAIKTMLTEEMIERYREDGGRWREWVLYDWLKDNADVYPKKEAIVDTFYGFDERRRRTWGRMFEEVNLIILNLLNLGVKKESRFIFFMPNIIENFYMHFVTSKFNATQAPLQVNLGEAEIQMFTKYLEPEVAVIVPSYHGRDTASIFKNLQKEVSALKYIFAVTKPGETVPEGSKTRPFSDLLDPRVKEKTKDIEGLKTEVRAPWDLMLTSGTAAGIPKMMVHSAATILISSFWAVADRAGISPYDRLLVMVPMNGPTGLCYSTWVPAKTGCTAVYHTEYDEEESCKLVEQEKITAWGGIPTHMIQTATSPFFDQYDMSTLRLATPTGGIMPPQVAEKLWNKGIKTANCYGWAEAGATHMGNVFTMSREKLIHTVGPAFEGYGFKIIDTEGQEVPCGEVGEICVKSPHHGYFNAPELNKKAYDAEGWSHSGDAGFMDEDGNLTVVGRIKEMILKGAQNIYPVEIEDIILKDPKIREVQIVGMPDKTYGEDVCAYIVPNAGETITLDYITSIMEDAKVAKFKRPRRVEIIDKMPVSAGGKISKFALKEDITKKLKAEGVI